MYKSTFGEMGPTMKIYINKKYNTIAIYTIAVFAICLLLVIAIFKYQGLFEILDNIRKVLNPIIWGLVLAYLLNPLMMFFDNLLKKAIDKKKPHPRLTRYLSVTITSLLTLFVLSSLIAIVLPQIISSVYSIISNMPEYFNNIQEWFNRILENNPDIKNFVNEEFESFQLYITNLVSQYQPQLQDLVGNLTTGVLNFIIGIKDFFLGFIVMIYLLASKEMFQAQAKKVLYAFLPKKVCLNMLSVCHKADNTFIGFISAKVLDSIIIGILCFIAMTLMGMPFRVLISFIIGIMNLIPYFGPFIGAVPSGLLILLANPSKIVAFVVFIIILQQFDGNILGPKILGDSTGLPSFWVLFAIFIGGGFFGLAGILLCVPVFAVIYMLLRELIENKLKSRNLPFTTKEYHHGKRIVEVEEIDDTKLSEEINRADFEKE